MFEVIVMNLTPEIVTMVTIIAIGTVAALRQ
jgi:hypothetical protein